MILFEVILATAIFCLVGLALANGLGDAAEAMRQSNRTEEVRLGLQSRIAEARALPLQLGSVKEKPDAAGVAYEREWEVVSLANKDKAALPGLYQLTVRASWTDHGQEDAEEATVRVYRPQS